MPQSGPWRPPSVYDHDRRLNAAYATTFGARSKAPGFWHGINELLSKSARVRVSASQNSPKQSHFRRKRLANHTLDALFRTTATLIDHKRTHSRDFWQQLTDSLLIMAASRYPARDPAQRRKHIGEKIGAS